MKQHITTAELCEIGQNNLNRLCPFLRGNHANLIEMSGNEPNGGWYTNELTDLARNQFNIGNMIAFLSKDYILTLTVDITSTVTLSVIGTGSLIHVETKDELCDALWETLKYAIVEF